MKQKYWGLSLSALFTVAALGSAETIEPFNGKDLSGWQAKGPAARNAWKVGKAVMDPKNPRNLLVEEGGTDLVNSKGHGLDFYTVQKFGDCRIELDVMVPKGSNSGVYVMGEYEVQVLDSFGRKKLGMGDMGAIYSAAAPKVNATKPPGQWQTYLIEFRAPRFDDAGKKTENAQFLKVVLNGTVLHENIEMKGKTPGGVRGRESATGPIMFQGNHGPVAYRNIRITPTVK
ncbi:MAG: DUF1080 domain-containing protein [Planctomycetota bacterium]|jgi:hypothetical protein|nr:DUF1080 domain-containing protein [Planctomycetota bacterium]